MRNTVLRMCKWGPVLPLYLLLKIGFSMIMIEPKRRLDRRPGTRFSAAAAQLHEWANYGRLPASSFAHEAGDRDHLLIPRTDGIL